VPDYRAYIVDADDHFIKGESFEASDDKNAIERAKQLLDGHDIELWSGRRLVVRLKHDSDRGGVPELSCKKPLSHLDSPT